MRYSSKASVEFDLEQHYKLRDYYTRELKARSSHNGCFLKVSKVNKGKPYYSVRMPGSDRFAYAGDDKNEDVILARECAFYNEALKVIERNIALMEQFLRIYNKTHAENINELLRPVYKLPSSSPLLIDDSKVAKWIADQKKKKESIPVFDPANLKVIAFDGTRVRSRAEDIHLQGFCIYGVPAVFEVPYKIGSDILRPDFTTLDVYTMRTKIWEHLGNWFHENPHKRNQYRNESIYRIDQYSNLNFFPEQDLLLTFGQNENCFDAQAIHRKIAMLALPPPSEDSINLLKSM